jgi:hypothetical protein
VTLGAFEAGGGWEAQVRQYVRKKYRQDLDGLKSLDPGGLARALGAELLPGRPYASIQWVLRKVPFRPLEVYFLFDLDPEFGSDLRLFYARKSLTVPTEDAYVFAWDYVALLARYGRGEYDLEVAGPGPDWLAFSQFASPGAGPIKDAALGPREEALRLLKPEVVEVALRRLDAGAFARWDHGWEAAWPVLGDLSLRLRGSSQEVEAAFDSHGARKYPPEFLLSFAWLYANALLREGRRVDPSLPRLSRYF